MGIGNRSTFAVRISAMFKPYLDRIGISRLNPMQEAVISAVKPGTDLVLLSPTGSGKTLAFLLPLLRLLNPESRVVQAMILTPTRELALQIEQIFRQFQSGLKVNTCYGGHPIKTEKNNLKEPPALLIGTPGRIADHLRRGNLDISTVSMVVLDEFDKSLELGYQSEMEFIFSRPARHEIRILTSATSLDAIPAFTGITRAVTLSFQHPAGPAKLAYAAVRADGNDKQDLLFHLLCYIGNAPALVFFNHRDAVNRISSLLAENGIIHGIYHGGLEQEQRELALIRFRNGSNRLLLATDLASRGLDIPEIMHVIHYQLPATETVWTHRNGRTARMHAGGTAWLVLAADEYMPEFISGPVGITPVSGAVQIPAQPEWETIYIGAGKKDKISRGDVAGFLLQNGNLAGNELGKIEVLDYAAFAAVKRSKCAGLLKRVSGKPIKKKQVKIAVAV